MYSGITTTLLLTIRKYLSAHNVLSDMLIKSFPAAKLLWLYLIVLCFYSWLAVGKHLATISLSMVCSVIQSLVVYLFLCYGRNGSAYPQRQKTDNRIKLVRQVQASRRKPSSKFVTHCSQNPVVFVFYGDLYSLCRRCQCFFGSWVMGKAEASMPRALSARSVMSNGLTAKVPKFRVIQRKLFEKPLSDTVSI